MSITIKEILKFKEKGNRTEYWLTQKETPIINQLIPRQAISAFNTPTRFWEATLQQQQEQQINPFGINNWVTTPLGGTL